MTGDEWAVAVSTANGSSDNGGGFITEEMGSDSVDGFWTSKTKLVDDRFLLCLSIGGGLRSCIWDDGKGWFTEWTLSFL